MRNVHAIVTINLYVEDSADSQAAVAFALTSLAATHAGGPVDPRGSIRLLFGPFGDSHGYIQWYVEAPQ